MAQENDSSGEVVVVDPETGEVVGNEIDVFRSPQAAVAALIRGAALEYADPTAIQESIALRILTADSEADAFAELPTVSTKDAVGHIFLVRDLRVFRSRYNGGEGGFVACDAVDVETGEEVILNTSAAKIGAKLIWLKMHDALPREVRIKELAGETAAGFKVLDIETVPNSE